MSCEGDMRFIFLSTSESFNPSQVYSRFVRTCPTPTHLGSFRSTLETDQAEEEEHLWYRPPTSSSVLKSLQSYHGNILNNNAGSCPAAELMVKDTVRSASVADPTIPGKLLRLLFHDCFVEGCDASILLQGDGTERSDPANKSLGGFAVIDAAKRVLEIFCPGTISCADILALAARDAVEFAGGPNVPIPKGRKDGKTSIATDVRPNIIDTSFTLDQMAKIFSAKGLSMDDLVTLSGAHTIGTAHCSSFNERYTVDSNGSLVVIDRSLDRQYASQLTRMCPAGGTNDAVTVSNDPATPLLFDNQYYKILLAHKGLFQSDSALLSNARTRNRVVEFANDENSFFERWAVSFLKLSGMGVKNDDQGEIRRACSVSNG